MTKDDQKRFVADLTTAIARDIIEKIDADRVPDDWNGFELRQLIADKASDATFKMPLWRRRAYHKTYRQNYL